MGGCLSVLLVSRLRGISVGLPANVFDWTVALVLACAAFVYKLLGLFGVCILPLLRKVFRMYGFVFIHIHYAGNIVPWPTPRRPKP